MFVAKTTIAALAALVSVASAHMEMSKPYALRSKFDPANKAGGKIDYSMTSPLEADGSNYPCKGYQNDSPLHSVATYQAGQQYQMELAGSATHNGGSCQLSLSYDNGKTFRVIKSIIGGCPLESSYDFTVPEYAPNGTALFAWTWQNHSGNREFYMNCAVVDIVSKTKATKTRKARSEKRRRDSFNSFDQLPYIWRANMPNVNECKTTEGEDPNYPNPGPDVSYGKGMSASSKVTDGKCDTDSPSGPTYKSGSLDVTSSENDGGSSSGSGSSDGSSAGSSAPSSAAPMLSAGGTAGSPVAKQTAAASSAAATSTADDSSATSAVPSAAASSAAASSVAPSAIISQALAPASALSSAAAATSTPSVEISEKVKEGGSCKTNGAFSCLSKGKKFAVCDNNVWIDMGAVAPGMKCQGDGDMVVVSS